MKKLLVFIIIIFSNYCFSQSVTGTSGLIHIPSARMLEDEQLVLGAAYIPKSYFQRYGRRINPGLNTYITYGILPFVEVMFRYTHELNIPVNNMTLYFPDRMLGLRVRIIEEKKLLPTVVFGLQDASAIIGQTCFSCSTYSATYFVSSKNFITDFGDIDISIGYAFDFLELKTKDYKGAFGGLSFNPNFNKNLSFNLEYNSNEINSGIKINLLSKFNFIVGFWNLDQPTFAFNYYLN